MALDCFQTLAHLHSIKLAHTDLKPENILFTAAGRPDVTSGTVSLTLTLTLNPSSPSPSTVASTSASALSGPYASPGGPRDHRLWRRNVGARAPLVDRVHSAVPPGRGDARRYLLPATYHFTTYHVQLTTYYFTATLYLPLTTYYLLPR